MKKWFSLCGMISLLSGAIILGETLEKVIFIQMLAMVLLIFGGLFMGLRLTER